MHWHAIRQSANPSEDTDSTATATRLHLDGNNSTIKEAVCLPDYNPPHSMGDDACDVRLEHLPGPDRKISDLDAIPEEVLSPSKAIIQAASSEMPLDLNLDNKGALKPACGSQTSSGASRRSRLTEDSIRSLNSSFSPFRLLNEFITPDSNATVESGQTSSTRTTLPFLQVSIPTYPTNNLAPFAYQRALRNRVRDDELGSGRKYDIKAYTPIFVHDCLMMPGSLANIRGKGSVEDVVRRMTPALLPGFHAHAHATTHEPLLLQSSKPGDYVHGMLILGQSKQVRENVHQHYRSHCKRVKVEVELDTVHAVQAHERTFSGDRWELRRRSVWAHAWIWKNAQSGDARFRSRRVDDGWRFDDYLAEKQEPAQSLRIEPAGWIQDDRETTPTDEMPEGSNDGEAPVEDWTAEDDPKGDWEEGSGAGAAVEWDDNAWINWVSGEDTAQDEYYVDRGAFDRDYDRSGSAGCW